MKKHLPLNTKRLTTAKIWKEITDLLKEYRRHPSRPSLSHNRNLTTRSQPVNKKLLKIPGNFKFFYPPENTHISPLYGRHRQAKC
jgi:hypothetical protein